MAPLLTPLVVLVLVGESLPVDAGALVVSIVQIVLVPVVLGLVLRMIVPRLVERFLDVLPLLGPGRPSAPDRNVADGRSCPELSQPSSALVARGPAVIRMNTGPGPAVGAGSPWRHQAAQPHAQPASTQPHVQPASVAHPHPHMQATPRSFAGVAAEASWFAGPQQPQLHAVCCSPRI